MSKNDIEILFEDQHLLVISKPAGLRSQKDQSGKKCLVEYLQEHVQRKYVGLVHRLDINTSGLMVVAKRSKAANRLSKSIQERKVSRTYIAVLRGHLEQEEKWENYLKKSENTRKSTVYKDPVAGAKFAASKVKPLAHLKQNWGKATLAKFELLTGRFHQIRAQAAFHGFPLLGDRKYNCHFKETSLERPALHCAKICFPHPMSKEILSFTQEVPQDLNRIIEAPHSFHLSL